DRIEKLPQTELVADKGYEILYFTDEVDEFAIRMLMEYEGKEFRSVSSGDLGIDTEEESQKAKEEEDEHHDMFAKMKELLSNKVSDVKVSKRLKSQDRKSTRLNSSHVSISYAVFCLKKKKIYVL